MADLAECRVNRAQLGHVIRASAAISGDDEIVIIGSQAILGQFPSPPAEREKDLEFAAAAARHGLVARDELLRRLATMPIDEQRRTLAEQRIRAHYPP